MAGRKQNKHQNRRFYGKFNNKLINKKIYFIDLICKYVTSQDFSHFISKLVV